ncbi:MAG: translation elongation factor Ts [Elusimicrobiota bacterium]
MADGSALILELRQKTGAGFMDCKKALAESNGRMEEALTVLRKKGLADAAKRSARATGEGRVAIKIAASKSQGLSGDAVTNFIIGCGDSAMVELNCETDFVARTPDFESLAAAIAEKTADGTLRGANDAQDLISPLTTKLGENITLKRMARYQPKNAASSIAGYIHHGGKIGALMEMSFASGDAAQSDAAAVLAKELLLQIVGFSPRYLSREEVPAEIIAKEKEIHAEILRKEGKPEAAVAKIVEGKINKLFYQAFCLIDQVSVRDNKTPISQVIADAGKQLGGPVSVLRFTRYQVGGE